MFVVVKHILTKDGVPVAQKMSPNRGGVMRAIDYLIVHYTGGVSAAGAINTLTSPAAKVSAHLVIDADGAVTQLLPLNVVGWHAGQSVWKKRSGCNNFTIGIEHVNPGLLAQSGANKFVTRLENKPWPAAQTILAVHKSGRGGMQPWAVYPQAQFEASIAVGQAIRAAYGIKDVLGHDDIAPIRKTDPGPAWHMDVYRSRVMGRA